MLSSLHVHVLKLFIQIFFIIQSIILIIPSCLYRLILKLFSKQHRHINPFKHTHEDVFKSRHEILKVQGFQIQQYQCQTQDDAYVSLWRIIPIPNQNQNQNQNQNNIQQNIQNKQYKIKKKPVLIQHGLLDCSMSWFLHQNPQNCLPYILAKQGYDVWVGNNRGTKYSSRNSHNRQYWQYNLDHLIQYDIPCLINHILIETSSQKLIYIGHSQGTTQFLSAIDIHPQLGNKIQIFIGFGPVISLKYLNNHNLLKIMDKLKICQILKIIGFKSMLIIPNWMSKLIGILIYNCWLYYKGFLYVVTGLCGNNRDKDRINLERFGVIISHQPGGSSINNVLHWMQIYRNGYLYKYNYGNKKNIQLYGSQQPPIYTYNQLKNQQFECHLFRGTADKVITQQDFNYLIQKLNKQKYKIYMVEDYAHLDYIWCQDANQDIYQDIIKMLKLKEIEKEKQQDKNNNSEQSNQISDGQNMEMKQQKIY